jgi:diguanylate cyclase (GGDEF)-like protein
MQLAAEVDTLKAELADARVRVALLEISAERDPLLDILNRRGFERELMRSLSYVRRYGTMAALIYIDLDGFKPVNDRFGHAAGDAMLQAVAATLSRNVRASDVVARLGGDELAVLLWTCSGEDAIAKAETLEALIAATTITWAGEPMSVGASAGAAALESEDGPADVLARADRSMYARKALHRKAGRRGPREK